MTETPPVKKKSAIDSADTETAANPIDQADQEESPQPDGLPDGPVVETTEEADSEKATAAPLDLAMLEALLFSTHSPRRPSGWPICLN